MSTLYPNLKFGEITVQYDDNFIQKTLRYLNYDTIISPTSEIVILFHDTNEAISTMDIIPDREITYSESNKLYRHPFTISIGKHNRKIYKRSTITDKNNRVCLAGFADIYKSNYDTYITDSSAFNCIYYIIESKYPSLERVVFSLLKRKYGLDSSRFLFSYDEEIISKQQVQNIIYKILTG